MQSFFKILPLATALFAACQNQPAPPAAASAILKHKYWVSKPFNDALAAPNITDTIAHLPCSELIFTNKDSVMVTACLSDAGRGTFKTTGANTLEFAFEGFENKKITSQYDEKTGILHLDAPEGWEKDFVPHDGIDFSNVEQNGIINLARKRLAGNYTMLPQKGEMAIAAILELRADGSQTGLGEYDLYEPWPSGISGGSVLDKKNILYLVKKNAPEHLDALAWQLHGDTLRLWDTKNINPNEMPDYKITGVRGTYLRTK